RRMACIWYFLHFFDARDWQILCSRRINNFLKKLSDDFVTYRRYANLFAGSKKFAGQSRACVRLSRAWRALYRQNAMIQLQCNAPAFTDDINLGIVKFGRRVGVESWWVAKKQVTR